MDNSVARVWRYRNLIITITIITYRPVHYLALYSPLHIVQLKRK